MIKSHIYNDDRLTMVSKKLRVVLLTRLCSFFEALPLPPLAFELIRVFFLLSKIYLSKLHMNIDSSRGRHVCSIFPPTNQEIELGLSFADMNVSERKNTRVHSWFHSISRYSCRKSGTAGWLFDTCDVAKRLPWQPYMHVSEINKLINIQHPVLSLATISDFIGQYRQNYWWDSMVEKKRQVFSC